MISKEEFKREIEKMAAEIGVQPTEIHIRPMKNKWGSCSTNGRLSFSTALLEESAGKRREVVVHELLHLQYPNHGKMFKAALSQYSGRHGRS